MGENSNSNDESVIAQLKLGLAESDPMPQDVAEFAKAAFGLRNIDAELAAIAYDSTQEEALSGVRSATTARIISFEAGELTIDIEYNASNSRLIGQINPRQQATVELELADDSATSRTDATGRFQFDDVPNGPMRLTVRFEDDSEVVSTEWTIL